MAEYLARDLSASGDVTFASAGTGTRTGGAPSTGTIVSMTEVGLDVANHRSQSVWEIGESADVIYALSAEHRDAMVERWPDRAEVIRMLRPDGASIDDPYGMELEEYRRARDEIEASVRERTEAGW